MSIITEVLCILVCTKALKSTMHFTFTAHLALVVFQLLRSHMWLVAAILDSTAKGRLWWHPALLCSFFGMVLHSKEDAWSFPAQA